MCVVCGRCNIYHLYTTNNICSLLCVRIRIHVLLERYIYIYIIYTHVYVVGSLSCIDIYIYIYVFYIIDIYCIYVYILYIYILYISISYVYVYVSCIYIYLYIYVIYIWIYIYMYIYMYTSIYRSVKSFCPFLYFFFFLHICNTWMIQIIKLIFNIPKITRVVNTKCSFEIMISFIKGKKTVQTCLALHEKVIAPKSNN